MSQLGIDLTILAQWAPVIKWTMWSVVMWIGVRQLDHFHVLACSMCRIVLASISLIFSMCNTASSTSIIDVLVLVQSCMYIGYVLLCENIFVYCPERWLERECRKTLRQLEQSKRKR